MCRVVWCRLVGKYGHSKWHSLVGMFLIHVSFSVIAKHFVLLGFSLLRTLALVVVVVVVIDIVGVGGFERFPI